MSGGEYLDLDLRLRVEGDALREARRQVGDLAAGLPQDLREDIQLLVSELVANSLRHAGLAEADWIRLKAMIGRDTVRVEVTDPGRSGRPDLDAEVPPPRSGLWMLNAIADRWGVVRDGTTRVWFESDIPTGSSEPAWKEVILTWPVPAQLAALAVARLYGPPDEWDAEHLSWKVGEGVGLCLESRSPTPWTSRVGGA